ncbi:MAG: hypothetical protein QOF60_2600 [Actinomycetota bacterium]|nr:hypothetical protein [Actinomycetota bacterium]
MTWLLDLDGVVWLADEPIPGAAEAVAALRAHGQRTVFVTNNSSPKLAEYLAKLERCGVPTEADDLITSAQAAASLVKPGATALVCAGPGVEEALRARGVETIRRGRADAVVVGWHRDFDFERLTAAFDAVHGGAPLVGTNDDATYPTPDGLLPGGGSILAAVAYASGATPTVAGKPYDAMVALARRRVDDPVMMVGDRPSTDGLFAQRLGVPFGLVLSGVTKAWAPELEPAPTHVADDLAGLVAQAYA